ncbi:hypothetical protein FQA39_LY13679 [Lamprigera yunnana]|nr:hypothetical protein FQA39_LY13679 [Lamprigera yunnana]
MVLLCITIGLSSQGEQVLFTITKGCAKKIGYHDDLNWPIIQKMVLDGGHKSQTFCECILKDLHCIGSNGDLLYDEIKKSPLVSLVGSNTAIIDRCKTVSGSTAEMSQKFLKCLIQPKKGITMNAFFVLLCLAVVSVYGKENDAFIKAVDVCAKKHNIDMSNLEQFVKSLMEGTQEMQLFCECCLKETGHISNGQILYDEFKKIPIPGVDSKKVAEIVENCRSEKGSTVTETAYKFSKCVFMKIMSSQNK